MSSGYRKKSATFMIVVRDMTDNEVMKPIKSITKTQYTALVCKPEHRFSVEAQIYPHAWDPEYNKHNYVHVELVIDGQRMATAGVERPFNAEETVSHVFEGTTPERRPFRFSLRHEYNSSGDFENVGEDSKVGTISVNFRKARGKPRRDREDRRYGSRPKRRRVDVQIESARTVRMDGRTKERTSVCRTVLGEARERYVGSGGGSGYGPRYEVLDWDHPIGVASVMYDTAENLRNKQWLDPIHCHKHRKHFPNEDWKKIEQRLKENTIVETCDLTGGDDEVWTRTTQAKMEVRRGVNSSSSQFTHSIDLS